MKDKFGVIIEPGDKIVYAIAKGRSSVELRMYLVDRVDTDSIKAFPELKSWNKTATSGNWSDRASTLGDSTRMMVIPENLL